MDINARLALAWMESTFTLINIDKIYTYLDTPCDTLSVPLIIALFKTRKILENIKRGNTQHPQLESPNDPDKDIWSYHKLLWINTIVFDDHLVVVLQVFFGWEVTCYEWVQCLPFASITSCFAEDFNIL